MIYLYHKIDKAFQVLNQNLRMAGIFNGGGVSFYFYSYFHRHFWFRPEVAVFYCVTI